MDPYEYGYPQQNPQFHRQPSEISDGGYMPTTAADYDPYRASSNAGYSAGGAAGYGVDPMNAAAAAAGVPYGAHPDAGAVAAAGGGGGGPVSASVSGSGGTGRSSTSGGDGSGGGAEVDFDDPRIAELPRILLMGPRRGGKTSIQRVVFHKMSPHETLFRLEATQNLERFVVDHTPLCRFTIWDFPGDYYGPGPGLGVGADAAGGRPAEVTTFGGGGGGEAAGYYGAAGGQAGPDGPPADFPQQGGMPGASSPLQRQPPAHGGVDGGGPVDHAEPPPQQQHQQQQQQQEAGAGGAEAPEGGEAAAASADDGDAYVFGRATALIFVIDAQDEPYDHVLQSFTETVTRAVRANPHIAIEVFINKVDGELFLSDEAKYDCRRDVMQQVSDELADAGVPPDSVPISYHSTSIYDHSVFEAFSRVVQKLIPQLPTLENLLNVLVSTCSMEKAYLFDVASKLYISTDSSPVDMQSVELCSDMIDVVLDVSGIYGLGNKEAAAGEGAGAGAGAGEGASLSTPAQEPGVGDVVSLASDLVAKGMEVKVANANANANADDGDANAGVEQQSFITSGDSAAQPDAADPQDELVGTLISQGGGGAEDDDEKEKEADADSAYDSESASVIRLSNGMVLYLKEVDTMLALVCLTRSENFRKKSLINYNIACLKKALRALVQPTSEVTDS